MNSSNPWGKGERVKGGARRGRGGWGGCMWRSSIGFFHGMSPVSHPKWRGASVWRHRTHPGPTRNGGGRTPRSAGWIKDEIHTARVLFAALFRFFCRSTLCRLPTVLFLHLSLLPSSSRLIKWLWDRKRAPAAVLVSPIRCMIIQDAQRYNFTRDRSLYLHKKWT